MVTIVKNIGVELVSISFLWNQVRAAQRGFRRIHVLLRFARQSYGFRRETLLKDVRQLTVRLRLRIRSRGLNAGVLLGKELVEVLRLGLVSRAEFVSALLRVRGVVVS